MSLFGRKEKEEIDRLKKRLADKCDRLNCDQKIQAEQYRKITELNAALTALRKKKEADIEMLQLMLIYKNEKIEKLIKSKNQLRKEKVSLEDRVEELQQELMNERERADRYADACSASMEYGWQPVTEEEMEKAGFVRTETGWRA